MSKRKQEWHKADIRAAVTKKGWSLTALSLQAGLPEWTCRSALDPRGNIRGEKVIANVLGMTPEDIWPSRYERGRRVRRLQSMPRPVSSSHRQKERAA